MFMQTSSSPKIFTYFILAKKSLKICLYMLYPKIKDFFPKSLKRYRNESVSEVILNNVTLLTALVRELFSLWIECKRAEMYETVCVFVSVNVLLVPLLLNRTVY